MVMLKGSYYGVNKFKKYRKYDIHRSDMLCYYYNINNFDIRKDKKENTFYIHHSYSSTKHDHRGRWYKVSMTKDDLKWNDDKCTIIYEIPTYENECGPYEDNGIEYENRIYFNKQMTIKFTKKGYDKLKLIVNNCNA